MDAVDIGDDDVFAQRLLVDEIIDAGAQRLHPFQARRLLQHFGRQHGREGQKRISLGDMRADLGVMIGNIDRQLRKACLEPVVILVADIFWQSQKDQQVRHVFQVARVTGWRGRRSPLRRNGGVERRFAGVTGGLREGYIVSGEASARWCGHLPQP
jgi:hypothetical protein